MGLRQELTVTKVDDAAAHRLALDVIETVYRSEKKWVDDPTDLFPASDLEHPSISWFLALRNDQPVGVTRVLFEIPFGLYGDYQFQLLDPSIDVEAFVRNHKIAEVGRFAVLPEYRKNILVAAILMRAAATETVERRFTHFITDVFESDPNSPYEFHKRILGFEEVATHDHGELHTESRRITMLLNLGEAYTRMKGRRNWIFRYITEGWSEALDRQLSTEPST